MRTSHVVPQPRPKDTALLIPGIGIAYSKAVEKIVHNPVFQSNCAKAGIGDFSDINPDSLRNYDDYLQDNLYNQTISYVVNCTMSDLYQRRGITPDLGVGYSMGVYSSLYAAGYYSFETGLEIMRKAFYSIKEHCLAQPRDFTMGLILGFKESEIRELLFAELQNEVHIAVYNGRRNFVIAGVKEAVNFCLNKALELGAFSTRRILTDHPYHTSFLEGLYGAFTQFLNTLPFTSPSYSVLSLIDGKAITPSNLADSVARSLFTPLRFDRIVNALYRDYQISVLYETGPSKSMKRLVNYINKKMTVHLFEEEMAC